MGWCGRASPCRDRAFGVALLAFGWRLRRRSTNFALPVQGGGAGVLFLTVFAAHGFYGFISAEFAFALLVVMVLLTAALAVAQGSPALAALGVTGGFLALYFGLDRLG